MQDLNLSWQNDEFKEEENEKINQQEEVEEDDEPLLDSEDEQVELGSVEDLTGFLVKLLRQKKLLKSQLKQYDESVRQLEEEMEE